MRASKEISRKDVKENDKWKEAQCSEEWPICIQQLKKYKHCDQEIDVWVLKEEGPPKFIKDYLIEKQRKTQKPPEDASEEFKRLLIGRVPHICNGRASQARCKEIDGIELSELSEGNEK